MLQAAGDRIKIINYVFVVTILGGSFVVLHFKYEWDRNKHAEFFWYFIYQSIGT